MRLSWIPALAALSLVTASPVTNSPACPIVSAIISRASASIPAKKFCSSFLHISPTTTTVKPTITPSPVIVTVTSTTIGSSTTSITTVSSTAIVTITSGTRLPYSTFTKTETSTMTRTIPCFTEATILPPPSTMTSVDKRAATPAPQSTPGCFRNWKSKAISSACNCLSLQRSTVTVTSPTTLSTKTSTSTVITTTVPTTAITTTVTVSSSSTTWTTAPPGTITTTETVTLVASTPAADGMDYYVKYNPHDYNNFVPGPEPSTIQNYNDLQSGVIQDINTVRTEDTRCRLPGGTVDGTQIHVEFQGFFFASMAGNYTFQTLNVLVPNVYDKRIDNQLTVWHGDTAYGQAPLTYRNADYDALRAGYDESKHHGGSVTLTLQARQVVPFTVIWGNSGPIGSFTFYIKTPDGILHESTSGFFTPQCVDGPFRH